MEIKLTKEDWGIIVEGLEALKHKDFAGEMMCGMFEVMMAPKDDAPEEEKQRWADKMRLKKLDDQRKEEEKNKFKRNVEILKSKVILLSEEQNEKLSKL